MSNTTSRALLISSMCAFATTTALTQPAVAATADPTAPASSPAVPVTVPDRAAQVAARPAPAAHGYRLGAHAEIDLGILAFLKQGVGIAGGVTYGPFRAGLSYATFLSNPSLGGVPDGFDLRVNRLIGINAAYFIAQDTDRGFYVQGMFHIKEQGVTNKESGAHRDLDSLALGLELGYVWKFYKGAYVAPRVGALYYVKSPQPGGKPIEVGDRMYDNDRHKKWDTYYIPTLSAGYSW